ncbi:VanZ family protein [Stutzerimonas zhaodongensis]|nr:VanZ family protein [Stutzerimonas zhaodongensis]MCQ4314611.1 VanZ family protein [Stutzerimonas zhaodongensis]
MRNSAAADTRPMSDFKMQYQQARRLAVFGVAVLVIGFMALKDTPNTQLYQGSDKLYHWAGFTVLAHLAYLAFPKAKLGSLFVWIIVGAASIELLQALTPSRSPSLADMTVNIVGIMTGLGATQLTRQADRRSSESRRSRGIKRRSGTRSNEIAKVQHP